MFLFLTYYQLTIIKEGNKMKSKNTLRHERDSKKISMFFTIMLLMGAVLIPISEGGHSLGNIIIVPDDFTTIQEAIDHANIGDTVLVNSGTYREQISINKTIKLTGQNSTNTILEGNGIERIISVFSNGVIISGFNIKNCKDKYPGIGIFVDSSNNINISNNIFEDNNIGISIYNSDFVEIVNNVFNENKIGLLAERDFSRSKNYNVINNILINNSQYAIYVSDIEKSNIGFNKISIDVISPNVYDYYNFGITLEDSYNCKIYENYITGYMNGLRILLSDNIEIYKNVLEKNDVVGIYSYISTATIRENRIIENGKRISEVIPRTEAGGIIIIGRSPNKSILEYHYDIYKNIIYKNNGYGVLVDRSTSSVSKNDFVLNSKDAYFTDSTNIWSDNYWGFRRVIPKFIFGFKKTPINTWRRAIQYDLYPSNEPNNF